MPSAFSPEEINQFFTKLHHEFPGNFTELNYTNPYTLLVAVVLSAQSTDKGVNKATASLFQSASSPQQMLDLGQEAVRQAIKTISFYNTKSKHIIQLSQILQNKFQGQVPSCRKDLESLPGVGRKTANVILNMVYHELTIAVDTHIFRVANRTGLAPGKTPLLVEQNLLEVVPSEFLKDAHHMLLMHGRYICKARRPLCASCPVRQECTYTDKAVMF